MNTCQRCGDPCHRSGAVFCSPLCAQAARAVPRPPCAWCESKPASRARGRFCSKECASRYKADHVAKLVMRRKCVWCQEMFTPGRKPRLSPPQRFCSKRCAVLARSITMEPKAYDALKRRCARIAAQARERKRQASWDERTAGLTPGQAARKFWGLGYKAGHRRRVERKRTLEAA